jgi:FixJ family two-component response regulator
MTARQRVESLAMTPEQADRCAVAIVDDDSGIRDSLAVLLAMTGFPVRQYPSVEAFLADPEAFDRLGCLLVDQNFTGPGFGSQPLTGMCGIELLQLLSAHGRLPPAILFSARLTERTIRDAHAAGALAVLAKPVGPINLIGHLRAAMGYASPRIGQAA